MSFPSISDPLWGACKRTARILGMALGVLIALWKDGSGMAVI